MSTITYRKNVQYLLSALIAVKKRPYVCELLQTDIKTLRRWEKGQELPDKDRAFVLGQYFGIPYDIRFRSIFGQRKMAACLTLLENHLKELQDTE